MKKNYLSKLMIPAMVLLGWTTGVAQTTFSYTGSVQTYLVPSGVTNLFVDMQGGKGGDAIYTAGPGGGGARVQCKMAVTPGQILYIFSGGMGAAATASVAIPGGWNGGGLAGSVGAFYSGSGGGASDIRIGGIALSNRVIVAGGGGGGGYNCSTGQDGGAGGGLTGGGGLNCGTISGCSPTGGTQIAGGLGSTSCGGFGANGALGVGGDAVNSYTGGGGGGFYGGGSGWYTGGAGGSSYTDPTSVSSITHTAGYNTSGNGVVTIGAVPAIGGTTYICAGSTGLLTDAVSGGVWTSASTAIALVGSLTGVVTGVTPGTTTISYTIPGGYYATAMVTVLPLPATYTVTGGGSYCFGGSGLHVYLSSSNAGIMYQLYCSGIPVGMPIAGTGTTLDFGLQTVSGVYTVTATNATTGCMSTMSGSATITIDPLPLPISGPASVCVGASITLSSATSGGTWSSTTDVAIGSTSGVATGVSAGIATIWYTLPTGCDVTDTVTVMALPVITAVATPSSCGEVYTLTAGGALLYSWAPSTGLSCATCATTTITPSATTTYTVMGTDASGCISGNTVTINGDRIYGHITFGGITPDTLDMKVWLVQFDPTDSSIKALDSAMACVVDSIDYYEFDGKPAGNYLVKAKLLYGNPAGGSGYVPTYGLNSVNWYGGTTVAHTGGSDSLHIDMVYGTVPVGPGFIGGYVYAGAGKGTSDAGAAGMLIYLENTSSHVLTHTYTGATGAYSFKNLGYGNYLIYPEEYDYHTTPSATITLSAGKPTVNGINFKQYTTSRKIIPLDYTRVKILTSADGIRVFPNPSGGMVTIEWTNRWTGNGHVEITDVAGRKVFDAALNMDVAPGHAQFNLAGLQDGIYMITVKAGDINYYGQLLIQQ
jgi:hypothetical protein